MDVRQLIRFVTVADLGSYNRAAQALSVSQPSLTRSIQLLEQDLDARLFERGAHGALLTAMGEELLPRARMILAERARAIAAIGALRGGGGAERIMIGSDGTFAARRLPEALASMVAEDGDACFHVVEGTAATLLAALREGRISLALGARAPWLDLDGLTFEPLVEERASVMVRSRHRVFAGGIPDLASLAQAHWIVPDQDNLVEGWARMFIQRDLPVPPIAMRTSSLTVIRGALLAGDFICLGDHSTFADLIAQGQLVALDMGNPVYSRPAGLFRRSGTRLSARERALVALLRHQSGKACDLMPGAGSGST
ncbi:LysR family transcriptional regulator [Novosphingobium sp.]|uniref:LysR family transcriptional regulator n=1 Tax=Novosphingobium sp. TaxID=1874826 RepID=UPI0031DA065C